VVVDVTQLFAEIQLPGSRENLHLVERLDPSRFQYDRVCRYDRGSNDVDQTWTVKQELVHQDEQANRIYHEPRCHEGNYGLPPCCSGRARETRLRQGPGPDPATKDTATDFGRRRHGRVDELKRICDGKPNECSTILIVIFSLAAGARSGNAHPRRTFGITAGRTSDGKANFSGIWQANNEAYWDLQAHEARPER